MKNKKQPEIRIGNCANGWKVEALNNVVDRVTRKNKDLKTQLPLTISAQYGLVDQVSYFNKQVASKDMSNYYLLQRGEFAYNKSYSRDYPWGAIKRLDNYDMGALSSLYITFKPSKINSDFLLSYYDTNKWHKEVSMRATEGARNHGLLNISATDFLETELAIPSQEEQTKIGNFFKQLDTAISLQQQELTILKQTKQGFLQKMFPKEGESVPEVRFPGFTEDWKILKFSNIVNRISKKSNDNNLPKIEFEDIISGEGRLNKDISNKLDNRMGTVFEPNFILYGKLRPYLKNWLLPNFQGIALGDFWVFEPKNSDPFFTYYLIQTDKYQIASNLSSGTKMPRSDWKTVSETNFNIPTYEEQIQIGIFFKQLDEVITLHEQELEALQQTKKAFLQKMFV